MITILLLIQYIDYYITYQDYKKWDKYQALIDSKKQLGTQA